MPEQRSTLSQPRIGHENKSAAGSLQNPLRVHRQEGFSLEPSRILDEFLVGVCGWSSVFWCGVPPSSAGD
jgi:hypothetical protein